MRKQALCLLLASLSLSLCGCGIKRDANGQHAYLLNVSRPAGAPAETTTTGCLAIRSCNVANPYAGRNFIYKLSDVQYEQDYYNQFLTPPDKQAYEILTRWFRANQMFSCSPTVEQEISNWTLKPRIDVLCVDFEQMDSPRAVVQMYFELSAYDKTTNQLKIIHKKTYTAETALPATPSAKQIAEAMSRSMSTIIIELEKDLAGIISK